MSSYADIKINGHVLTEWQNTYHTWYFDITDRKRKVSNNDCVGIGTDFIGYEAPVSTIRRRLHLAGYDHKSLEMDFNETRSKWMRELNEALDSYRYSDDRTPLKGDDLLFYNFIEEELRVVESYSLSDWIAKLPLALNRESLSNVDTSNSFKVKVDGEPLISFMLSNAYGIFPEFMSFAGSFFPCMSMESYALALLENSKDDDLCQLDITALVNAGWVDDFEEIKQVEIGKTKFYELFESSINEIREIKPDDNTPILQRMVFSSVISVYEAYLSDTVKKNVLNRHAIKKSFVKNSEALKKTKNISLNDIFEEMDSLDSKIIDEIDSISFHNVDTAIAIYKYVLKCTFPEDKIDSLKKHIETRHDIVHRNGRKKNGAINYIIDEDVNVLIELVSDVVRHIDKQILDGLLDTGN